MSEQDHRPDPDALLRRLSEDEARARRGKLKIFFGFAPGVGKTYRMLQVARDLIDQKLEVVVGLIETHGRYDTATLMLGMELIARRKVEYRGRVLEEFDLDTALTRRPKLLLVDELAHTNAAGGRHAKRWQDVLELLDAGIDVFTTVNVQHLESLNDVIAQITGVQVRETFPDSLLDRADEIELVDVAPEELLQRLREGKVYLPDQAKLAAEHFFQRGNLLALRELALRSMAQCVDKGVQEYRAVQGVAETWPAGERILVCVGPSPSSARLVRSASRMAAGLRCPWVAAYVDVSAFRPMSEADRDRLEAHLRLAESLGGTVTRLSGTRIPDALLHYARKANVTRIVIGKPTHSRLRDQLRGSLLYELVRGSGDIDVVVISGAEPDSAAPRVRDTPEQRPVRFGPYAAATGIVGATLALAMVARRMLGLPDVEMLFILAVMITAIRFGRWPAVLAATLGVASYDFFFVPPFHTFDVADQRYVLTFAMMFGVGFVVSELTTRLKRQEMDALAREERTASLYALSRALGKLEEPSAIAEVLARQAAQVFDAAAFVLRAGQSGALQQVCSFPTDAMLDSKELGVARWCSEHGTAAGFGTETLPGASVTCAPLQVASSPVGVLAIEPRTRAPFRMEQRDFLEAFCRQAAFAFERTRLAEEARAAAVRVKAEETRSSLLSAVSHDLRTPLASITGAATALRDDDSLEATTRRDLLASICREAERLERLVANLLDMTRLESDSIELKRDWMPVEEIVGAALTRLESRLADRKVQIEIPDDLPLVSVDPVLFAQVFVNLIENAIKYAPADSPIEIVAERDGPLVSFSVMDRGPGLPGGAEERVFEKFFRVAKPGVAGVGLGLPICRAIAEAHGGTIRAENRPGGGATFRITIPLPGEPPAALPAEETES